MKYKITMTPETAVALLELYEAGELNDIGVINVVSVDEQPFDQQSAPDEPRANDDSNPTEKAIAILRVSSVSAGSKYGRSRMYYAHCVILQGINVKATVEINATNKYKFVYNAMLGPSYWRISNHYCKWGHNPAQESCEVHFLTNAKYRLKAGDRITILSP
jgi:hypothetical protein